MNFFDFFYCSLAPEYKKAAENLKGLVKVAAVDCDDQSNRNVCSAYDVKGKLNDASFISFIYLFK